MSDLGSASVPPPGPQDHVRGPQEGPLVIQYAHFSCPACALARARLRPLPVRLVFRHFPVRARHPRAPALACAAEAAARQGRFWEFHDSLFDDQGHQDDPHLWRRAEDLGLDVDRFEAERRSEEVRARVRRDLESGLRAGVVTTPTLFIAGRAHPGVPDDALLARLTAGVGGPDPLRWSGSESRD